MFFSFLVPISLTLTRHTAVQEFTECVIFKTHFAKRHENILLWKQCELLWMAHIYCYFSRLLLGSCQLQGMALPLQSPQGKPSLMHRSTVVSSLQHLLRKDSHTTKPLLTPLRMCFYSHIYSTNFCARKHCLYYILLTVDYILSSIQN